MFTGRLIVVAEEVVVGGDEEVADTDHGGQGEVTRRRECQEEGALAVLLKAIETSTRITGGTVSGVCVVG
jgi:hypothetical protein